MLLTTSCSLCEARCDIRHFRQMRGKKEREREGEADYTHGPGLYAWSSLCAVPAKGDPSERERDWEREKEMEMERETGDHT
ncbi:hypothetical protein ILYODFUR_018649 [Ilyodon furcidens]|uniref:Uncharacterized protein n=1 Tax=Ilyodon furcidens TaxID=33524 RepID=A0ABV0V666_9TELE